MNEKLVAILLFASFSKTATGLLPSLDVRLNRHPSSHSRRWSTVGQQDASYEDSAGEPRLPGSDLEALLNERAQQEAALADVNRRIWQARQGTNDRDGNVRAKTRIDPQWDFEDYNFGFVSKSKGVYLDSVSADGQAGPPSNLGLMAWRNLRREGQAMINEIFRMNGDEESWLDPVADPEKYGRSSFAGQASFDDGAAALRRQGLGKLVLSNNAVSDREIAREAGGSGVESSLLLRIPYVVLCGFIDLAFENRPIPRFWFLETVARMPYLSYISMLHLYESLGWWRRSADVKRIHFAEEWNEFHHLLIMEALGGDQRWSDRFLAQHAAIVYYFVLVALWLASPSLAYNFSELIEAHAVDTYSEFRDANAELLASLPAPQVAKLYYSSTDLYLFDEFQSQALKGGRRPTVETLLDVFNEIVLDEGAHVDTMQACQDASVQVRSPNNGVPAAVLTAGSLAAAAALAAQQAAELAAGGGLLMDLAGADAADDVLVGMLGGLTIELEVLSDQAALLAESFADAAAGVSSSLEGVLEAFTAVLTGILGAASPVSSLLENVAEDGSVVGIGELGFSPEVATDLMNLLETLPVLLDTAVQALQGFHF